MFIKYNWEFVFSVCSWYCNNIGSEEVSSEGLCELVFHEFSHASHYNKVGSGYWGNYINYHCCPIKN